ncbi:hypothetical protein KUH03_08140 [Sphingobacterium sp. E70]|uniref:hypothetical protein n=1 Tax=Sphingobacterium sp. E70 TaxID=2853439 RepID=UPI00211CADE6|nr:hypothetical protein [Sphingobacterium sp. E70]ULT26789.1 hypothetical protein KUH03_08140 [Sphingobacterium sp. E70]
MVAVYNAEGQVSYGGLKYDNQISKSLLTQLKSQKTVYFKTEDSFYFGLYYPDNQGDFFVFVKESNTDFNQQLNRLLFILVLVFWLP